MWGQWAVLTSGFTTSCLAEAQKHCHNHVMAFPNDYMAPSIRRSLLSVPAANTRALSKVPQLDCDGVIFDLEDSVAISQKAEARDNLRRSFAELNADGLETAIRINPLTSEFGSSDLDLVIDLLPDAVVIPKVEHAEDIRKVAERLSQAGVRQSVSIWAMIETPLGVLNAAEISGAGGRLTCLVVGLNDLRKATGVLPQPGRANLIPWLMQVVLAGRAHGVDVIDSVFNDFKDEAAFEAECVQGRAMGFSGKMLIHPAQIETANRHFGPDDAAVSEARAIIEAFRQPGADTLNVINLEGRMVERLHLEDAEKLVASATAIANRKRKP
jgi:citrate lyase subunit beta/citryl-CoA lyase